MTPLNLLIYCAISFFVAADGKSNEIRLKLIKSPTYANSLEAFKANVQKSLEVLKFYFGSSHPDVIRGKVDKNIDYYVDIYLGTGNKSLIKVALDTSFSGLWVPSPPPLEHNWFKEQKKLYDKSRSYIPDTIDDKHQSKSIIFNMKNNSTLGGKTDMEGILGFESLWVGDVEIPATHFMEATKIPYECFNPFVSDGIFGLGFPSGFLKMTPPFFTMMDRGLLDDMKFSLFLGKPNQDGEIIFGGQNDDYDTYPMQPHKLISNDSWKIKINSTFGKYELCPSSCEALVDTGTALIAVPKKGLKSIFRTLNLTYTGEIADVSCTARGSFPSLKIEIDSQTITLNGYSYTLEIAEKTCVLAIMESPKENLWILGNIFLSTVYTVFDIGLMQIEFGPLKGL